MIASTPTAVPIYAGSRRDRHTLLWLTAGMGALLLVALLAVASLMHRASERQNWVNQALLVQTASERLRVALQRGGRVVMEALAVDQPYDRAQFAIRREEVFQQLNALREMVVGNSEQVRRVYVLHERIAVQFDRLAALEPAAGLEMQQRIHQAQAGRGEIQQELDAILGIERQLLGEREAALDATVRWHRTALVAAVLAALALVLTTALALRAAAKRRDAADAAAAADRQHLHEERARLEHVVQQRTAELRGLVRAEQLRNECAHWLLGSLDETDDALVVAGWRDRVLASGLVQRLVAQIEGLTVPPAPAPGQEAGAALDASREPGLVLMLALPHGLGMLNVLTRTGDCDDDGRSVRQLCGDLGTWLQLRRERAARARAERERDESAAQLSALFDQLPVAVVLRDADLNVLRMNSAFAAIASHHGIELVGKSVDEQALIPGPDQVVPLLRRSRQGEVVKDVPVVIGDRRLLLTTAPLRRPDGQLFGVVGMAVDVTELEDARLRLQHLARRVMQIQESERRMLALELHDDLGQRLAALKMNLGLMGPPQDLGPDRAILDDTLRIVEGCIAQIRSRAASLRPALLDEMGVEAALRWHIADQARRSGAAITLESDAPLGKCRGEWATHVYRIVQEALRNALEHGGARDIAVQLHQVGDRVSLDVADDGCGLPPDALLRGNGLPGMRERAAMLGGCFETRAVEPHGTRILCHWSAAVTEAERLPTHRAEDVEGARA